MTARLTIEDKYYGMLDALVREEYDFNKEDETMENYFNMDSFGSLCPDNWEEVAAFLNAVLDSYGYTAEDADDMHDTANDLWESYCNEDLSAISDTAIYGRDWTHLRLTDKARSAYAGIDPCTITEYSADGNYLYQYTIAGDKSPILTEDELNEAFESMADE